MDTTTTIPTTERHIGRLYVSTSHWESVRGFGFSIIPASYSRGLSFCVRLGTVTRHLFVYFRPKNGNA